MRVYALLRYSVLSFQIVSVAQGGLIHETYKSKELLNNNKANITISTYRKTLWDEHCLYRKTSV